MGPINNIPALVQIVAWRQTGDKQLCEPMLISLPRHICITRPQWDNIHLPDESKSPTSCYEILNKHIFQTVRKDWCHVNKFIYDQIYSITWCDSITQNVYAGL